MATPSTAENPVKTMMRAGKVALGMNVRLARSGDIARIAKSSGHDFIFIDIQHSLFNLETIGHIAQAALGCGIAPLVRVRSCDDPDTSVLPDNGVTGIVFPDISTATEAQRAVNRAKFPPIGRRSVSNRSSASCSLGFTLGSGGPLASSTSSSSTAFCCSPSAIS